MRGNLFALIILLFVGSDSISNTALSNFMKERRPFILMFLFGLLFIVFGLACFGTIRQGTSFNVSVITEELRVKTNKTPMSKWFVRDIELFRTCPDDPDDLQYENFTGSIELLPGTQVIFTRIATGDLIIKLFKQDGQPTAKLINEEEDIFGEISNCGYFYIKDIEERAKRGETIVFPVTGNIEVGNEIRFLTHYKTPVLYGGKITILDKSFIFNDNYSVGPFELEMGDSFVVEHPMVPSQGFVSVNADSAIHLVFRAKGKAGLIKRYQAESFKLRNSVWSKLYQDEALSVFWMGSLFIVGVIRTFLRLTMGK